MKQLVAKILITIMLLTYGLPLLPVRTAAMIPLPTSTVMANVYEDSQQFPDVNLRVAVTSWLGKSVTDTVYKSDIIARLPASGETFSANNKGIVDLSGIEIFEGTGIQYLDLGRNSIRDITPVANLTSLEQLNVENNQVVSLVPVQNLVNLKVLAANSNSILDLTPVSSLNKLISLGVSSNAITDLTPLVGLVNITSLSLGFNAIANITPLTALTNLQTLQLGSNNISDLTPLTEMTKLQTLYLNNNNISDLSPIAGLVGVTSLNIGSNTISDLSPLSNLTNINQLIISSNNVNDLAPLRGMAQLNNLQASQNLVHDLSPLAGLSNLLFLNLQYNPIVDITPLSRLTKLSNLNLGNTFLNPFNGDGQIAADSIIVSGTKRISPVVKYGVTSGSSFVQSVQVETGKDIFPHYGFLQTSDGTNWSNNISWHQAFLDYYASTMSTFSSVDPSIAIVDSNGTISGMTPGSTQVTARLFNWSSDYTEYTFEVVVEERPVPSATPEPSFYPIPTPEPSVEPTSTTPPTPVASLTPAPTATTPSLVEEPPITPTTAPPSSSTTSLPVPEASLTPEAPSTEAIAIATPIVKVKPEPMPTPLPTVQSVQTTPSIVPTVQPLREEITTSPEIIHDPSGQLVGSSEIGPAVASQDNSVLVEQHFSLAPLPTSISQREQTHPKAAAPPRKDHTSHKEKQAGRQVEPLQANAAAKEPLSKAPPEIHGWLLRTVIGTGAVVAFIWIVLWKGRKKEKEGGSNGE